MKITRRDTKVECVVLEPETYTLTLTKEEMAVLVAVGGYAGMVAELLYRNYHNQTATYLIPHSAFITETLTRLFAGQEELIRLRTENC